MRHKNNSELAGLRFGRKAKNAAYVKAATAAGGVATEEFEGRHESALRQLEADAKKVGLKFLRGFNRA